MLGGVPRILLVCTGNICRSPMGHGILVDLSTRHYGGRIEVRSAGTWARRGSPATPEANAAAKAAGIDISRHKASPFARELAAWADLIVTMTDEQAKEVAESEPGAESKTFTLKELVNILESLPPVEGGASPEDVLERLGEAHRRRADGRVAVLTDRDVSDPLGLSETVYRAVAHELGELLERLVTGLVGRHGPTLAKEA
jgi:protein-tyrosine-phosphatase